MSDHVGRRAVGSMLVLAGILVVGLLLQPATAHIGTPNHLWGTHLRPKADARYLQNTNVYVSAEFTLGASANLTVDQMCPAGTQALGGGVDLASGAGADVRVTSNAPLVASDNLVAAKTGKNPRSNGWRVKTHNNSAVTAWTGSSARSARGNGSHRMKPGWRGARESRAPATVSGTCSSGPAKLEPWRSRS